MLEGEALLLKSQLTKVEKAREVAVSNSDGRVRKVRALEARVRLLCDEPNLLKRRAQQIATRMLLVER